MSARPRLHGLDAFRGFAALWVVVYHDTLRYPFYMRGQEMPWTPLFPGFAVAEAGVVPVLWFFLISGFVITWTIDRCQTPMDFVVSRVSRLYPAYWAAIAVSVTLGLLWPLPGTVLTPGQVLLNLTMLQDFVGVPAIDGVFWSLTIELRFYLYALALFALGLWPRVYLVALAWAVIILAVALANAADIWVPWRVQVALMTRYGGFLVAGMMIYRLWRRQHVGWSAVTLGMAVAAILVAYNPVAAGTCLAAMALIAWAAHGGLQWLAAPVFVWLGAISYSLYLSHQIATYTIIRALDARGVPHAASVLAAIGLALGLASAISYGVERPGLRVMRAGWRRWTLGRQPAGGAADGGLAAPPPAPGSPG